MTVGMRRGLVAMLAALVVPVLAGCGGASDAPKPISPVTSSATVTPSESPSPTPTWESTYTPSQVRKYRAALTRWRAYERVSAPIWATGKYTPVAKRIFDRYWHAPQIPALRLRQYQQNGVKVRGLVRVVRERPLHVGKDIVRIRQCVDGTPVTITQHGTPVPGAKAHYLRTVELDKVRNSPWLIVRLRDPSTMGRAKPCGD